MMQENLPLGQNWLGSFQREMKNHDFKVIQGNICFKRTDLMVAFLAQVLVWSTFTERKLCTVNLMQHSYRSTVWGKIKTHLTFLKGIAFSKPWGRLCDSNTSSLPQWAWMPPFNGHFSTPLFLSPPLQVLPSPASLPTMNRKLGSAAHKYDG